jgi:hypothetical protein
MESQQPLGHGANVDYPWDDFDSISYLQHNYGTLRPDDLQILEACRDFFCKTDRMLRTGRDASDETQTRGLDVGSGTNLYPALAMLPFCAELTLWEYSARNVHWLRNEIRRYAESWDPFWERLTLSPPYHSIPDPRSVMARRATVRQGSIFDLPARSWDMGTMFFVAESLTTRRDEFESATRRFAGALRPGSPFAAAFMENSTGYDVGAQRFPSFPATVEIVRCCLEAFSGDLDVQRISLGNAPLRKGYSGMIIALGTVNTG